jgi:hypothetical protein
VIARFAGSAPLVALILALMSAGAAAQDSQYLKWEPATKTVTFELIAGGEGAQSPFNFNGYTDGEANWWCRRESTW